MKSLKNSIVLLFIILLCSSGTLNRTSIAISGIVTDSETGDPLSAISIHVKGTSTGTISLDDGKFFIDVTSENSVLVFSFIGYTTQEITVGTKTFLRVKLEPDVQELQEVVTVGYHSKRLAEVSSPASVRSFASVTFYDQDASYPPYNTEEYATIHDNTFLAVDQNSLSTFSIDVDNASYSNMRRFINSGQNPPKDVVRIEEMINYFTYDYPQPSGEDPFSVNTEISDCPWNADHRLVHIGLQGKKISTESLPPSNLVFLIDISGSMQDPQKLPLLKSAFKLLVNELRKEDRISIVVYGGGAGVTLPATSGDKKVAIVDAIEKLEAGGYTAGAAGIELAYKIAEENFKKNGNNRVILASDGDFNIGSSSNAAMERLIEEKRESGISLTVLGFGMGNYKDSKMEILADKGNGNYAYIDNILEAKKVFVNEFGGTLFTIAKDVKLQVEFNPTKVKGYRLIGYENRMLQNEDFNNDKKDAGDLGSGHTVTALYEIIPAGIEHSPFLQTVDNLKYQNSRKVAPYATNSDEILNLKLRYKKPDGNNSSLIEKGVVDQNLPLAETSDNFRFSAAVASFGMLLRDSEFKGNTSYSDVLKMAEKAKGKDEEGYRAEFLNLIRSSQLMAGK